MRNTCCVDRCNGRDGERDTSWASERLYLRKQSFLRFLLRDRFSLTKYVETLASTHRKRFVWFWITPAVDYCMTRPLSCLDFDMWSSLSKWPVPFLQISVSIIDDAKRQTLAWVRQQLLPNQFLSFHFRFNQNLPYATVLMALSFEE